MKTYECEFTLEGGAVIEAESYDEALDLAKKEAERQYGSISSEMYIEVYENE